MNIGKAFQKGERVGLRYDLESVLGKGRSATIYKAFDLETRSFVALKILDPFLVQDPTNVERFKREAAAIRSLSHPGIIKVYDLIRTESSYAIVMEYFEGVDLKVALNTKGSFSVADFMGVAEQIAGAVEACHGARVLHRDLKPQNILINAANQIKVVDFGISKMNSMSDLTKTGTFLGTPEYMAPELFTSPLSDPRADVYGLGAVFFEMLYGKSPYAGLSIQHVMAKQAEDKIPSLREKREDVPLWLEAIIVKCLKRDPDRRFQSVYEIRSDLNRGEGATSLAESQRDRICCWQCKQDLVIGLPFCHQCGQWLANISEAGQFSVAIYDFADADQLLKHITTRLSLPLTPSAKALLRRRPVILIRNISEPASKAIYHSLGDVAVRALVHDRLTSQLKLPLRFVGVEAVLLLPLFLNVLYPGAIFKYMLLALLYTALSQIPIFWLFQRQTRCLTRPTRNHETKASASSLFLSKWHDRMMAVGSSRIRMLLAIQLRTFASLSERGLWEEVEDHHFIEGLNASFAAGARLSEFEAFLSSTSLSEIKENIRETELKIRVLRDGNELAKFIQKKARLEQGFRNYVEVQQSYSELYLSLLGFQVVLSQFETALASQLATDSLVAQCDKICSQLWEVATTPKNTDAPWSGLVEKRTGT